MGPKELYNTVFLLMLSSPTIVSKVWECSFIRHGAAAKAKIAGGSHQPPATGAALGAGVALGASAGGYRG